MSRIKVLQALFCLKALLALSYALSLMAGLSYLVYSHYLDAKIPKIIIDPSSPACHHNPAIARLELDHAFMFGWHLDWNKDTPISISRRVDSTYSIFNSFYTLNNGHSYDKKMMNWHADEVAKVNGILAITMEPTTDMSKIPDSTWTDIASQLKSINEKGVPIYFRLGHEMNGIWTSYGMRPIQYKTGYRKCAIAIRAETNMTALVWAPNLGVAYPFGVEPDSQSPPPTMASEPEEFKELDTNRDGLITSLDDAYTPYYPGDEWVDWVGLSLYHYPTTENRVPGEHDFINGITGAGHQASLNFYERFVIGRGKPFMVAEGASPWLLDPVTEIPFISVNGATELQVKQTWWKQWLDAEIYQQYPRIKSYINFEEYKYDGEKIQDFTITNTTVVLNAFKEDVRNSNVDLVLAKELRYACDGSIKRIKVKN